MYYEHYLRMRNNYLRPVTVVDTKSCDKIPVTQKSKNSVNTKIPTISNNNINIFAINVQSLTNKQNELKVFLKKYDHINVLCTSEHWMKCYEINKTVIGDLVHANCFCRDKKKNMAVQQFS